MQLRSCTRCDAFLPPHAQTCPHCETGSTLSKRLIKLALNATGGGLIAMTLMACYGLPPCEEGADEGGCIPPVGYCQPGETDLDEDGWCSPKDCNDEDPDVYPWAPDPADDDIDQNCDGEDGIASE